jgi:hypothetical protein
LPLVTLGGPAGPAIALEHRHIVFAFGRWWTVVDETLHGNARSDSFDDQSGHFQDPFTTVQVRLDAVADLDRCRWFRRFAVDLDMASSARRRRIAARLGHPHRPQPLIHTRRFDAPSLPQPCPVQPPVPPPFVHHFRNSVPTSRPARRSLRISERLGPPLPKFGADIALSATFAPNFGTFSGCQAGICWVMQWMPPPPAARMAPTSRASASRPGYCSAMSPTMAASAGCPQVGIRTKPLPR